MLWRGGIDGLKTHLTKNILTSIAVGGIALMLVYGSVFSWSLVKAIYSDHGALIARNAKLQKDLDEAPPVPPKVIPQDPVGAFHAVEGMRYTLKKALENKETITFLITYSTKTKDGRFIAIPFFWQMLDSSCRDTPRQCRFSVLAEDETVDGVHHATGPVDLDRPLIAGSPRSGITVHGPDATAIAQALSQWFKTYSTSGIPPTFSSYKYPGTKDLIWIEIGPGSPWKQQARKI
jgi:hypothetical protein